jgi:excisionase family DNA binding protein
MENYLTINEVAELLKVSVRTVNNWTKNKKMPYISIEGKKGSPRRFLESEVREWFEGFNKNS